MKANETKWNLSIWLIASMLSCRIYDCRGVSLPPKDKQKPLEFVYEFADTDKNPERKLAYFREDPSLGAGHLSFHNAVPFWIPAAARNFTIYREGELFYYYHQQLASRYDAERLSVGFPRVIPFKDFFEPILEGYFPNYPPMTTKYNYFGRPANMTLADVPGKLSVKYFSLWRDRLVKAVKNGYILHQNGSRLPINNPEGTDLIAKVSQSTADSPNHKYYGCYHTHFHLLGGKISDPEEQFYEHYSVIQDFTIGVMDPLFYRYHKYVVDLFSDQKALLPSYTKQELSWNDVTVEAISVIGDLTKVTNQLTTYTQQWKPLMKHGFDFLSSIPVKVLFKILQHEEFTYTLKVENLVKKNVTATVRLYLAPVSDENGNAFQLQEQRQLFSELDKFKVKLQPGKQTISRYSTESWVTVPLEKSTEIFANTPITETGLLDLAKDPCIWPHRYMNQSKGYVPEVIPGEFDAPLTPAVARSNCGWPHHLLIPKGKKHGMQFVLFAMLTDWQEDKTRSSPEQDFVNAGAYCGIFNDTYPDKRPMGFPFDRKTPDGVTLKSFQVANMAVTTIKIYHSEQVVSLDGTFDPSIK